MKLRNGRQGLELCHYDDVNALRMQQLPAGVLSLKGSELKVKAQNQVAAATACCSRMRLLLLGWLRALETS